MMIDTPEAFAFLVDTPLGTYRYRVAFGGRGSAKSWQFARALIGRAYERPLRIGCFREFQSSMRESVHHLISEQIVALGLTDAFTIGQYEITGTNGSSFLFKGLKRDPNGVRSMEGLDVAWVEEAHAVSHASWQVLIPTVRKDDSEIWVTFNPGEPDDPTYKMFITDPPPRSIVRKVGYKDNPWLPQVLLEEARTLKARDPEAYAHVWGGEPWTRSDTQVLVGKYVVDDFTPAADWDGPYFGADWGFSNDPTVLVELYRHADRLYLSREVGGVGLDMDQTAYAFASLPGAKAHMIRADSARPETINEMRRRGFRIEGAPKWSGSVEDGIAHLRSYLQIVVHPRCTRAIEEARLWRYATNDAGEALPKLVDANDHIWSATRYALSGLIRRRQRPALMVSGG